MEMRTHPTAYAFATMPTLALGAGVLFAWASRSPMAVTVSLVAWAAWEGSVAHELAALAGRRQPGWAAYRRALVGSTAAMLAGLWFLKRNWWDLGRGVRGPRRHYDYPDVGHAAFGHHAIWWIGGGLALVALIGVIHRVRFVGSALATAEAGESARAGVGLAILGVVCPPLWALFVHHRARRVLLDGYEEA